MTEGDALATAGAALGTCLARRDHAAGHAAEDRLDHDAGVGVVEGADHLVTGHEREAHDIFEVARATAVEGGEVRSADARQQWSHPVPVGAGQLGRVHVDEAQGPDGHSPARASEARHQARGGEARQVALENQAFHRSAPLAAPEERPDPAPDGADARSTAPSRRAHHRDR